MSLKFYNVPPYYDDFDQTKNYMRILFRPGYSVQARELTQMQTALQAQIDRFGQHIFKDGSQVVGGLASLDTQFAYVKLMPTYSGNPVDNYLDLLVGTTMTGQTTGVTAVVLAVTTSTNTDPATLFVKYNSAGTDNTTAVFAPDEVLLSSFNSYHVTVRPVTDTPTGSGCRVTVTEGVFFVSGNFVHSPAGYVILSKYTGRADCRVVYKVTESIIDAAGDATLTDNALGTPNVAAPGANRYQIALELDVQPIAFADRSENNIIQLMVVQDGKVRSETRTTYSELGDTLAQRTFEESGNYTVRPFQINIREYYNDGTNNGLYTAAQILANDKTGQFDGSMTPLADAAAWGATQLAIGLEPSVAYVNGYRIETVDTKYITANRARDTGFFNGASVLAAVGNYVMVTLVQGLPDVTNFATVTLYDTNGGTGSTLGTARVRAIEYVTGSTYKVFLFDVNATAPFTSVKSLKGVVAGANFIANVTDGIFKDGGNNSLVFPLPVGTVKTLISSGGVNDTTYTVRRGYLKTTDGSGYFTLSTAVGGGTETFNSSSTTDWVCVRGDTGAVVTPVITPVSSTALQFFFSGLLTKDIYLTGPSQCNFVKKTKTVTRDFNIAIASPNTTPGNYDLLGVSDVLKVSAIYMSSGFGTPATTSDTDITNRYIVDSGQRDNFYDVARIQLHPGAAAPTGRLLVVCDYFSHGGGDYFSVDSYVNVGYDEIPSFQSTRGSIQLRDALDFRPTKDNTGSDFSGTGSSITSMIRPNTLISADIWYYLPRIDKAYVDKKGNFGIVEGISRTNPAAPEDPKDAMVLYVLGMGAYTFSPADVVPTMIDNKRYTMRDIGSLDKRISKLEYYTSLSLLEQTAASSQILDATSGNQRYKNGFIVDNFYGSNIAAVTHPDFRASMDKSTGTLRPLFLEDNINLYWNSGSSSNIRKTGPLLTLDYYQADYITQPYASQAEFVNPYNVFNWTGSILLSPNTDEWKETQRAPDVVIDQTGIYDALTSMLDSTGAIGTVWNEWQTNWTGSSVSTDNSNVFTPTESLQLGFQTVVSTTTTTTTTSQARTGISKSVVPDTVTQSIGDKIVEINFVPFIRSRLVYFKASGLKPNTEMFAFFDGQSIANFVRTETTFVDYSLRNSTADVTNYMNATAHPAGATSLVTDAAGDLIGSFIIPNTTTLHFKTGSRIFRLTDSSTNSTVTNAASTWAEAMYTAQGILQTVENQIISTQIPVIQLSSVSDSRVITNTSSNSTSTNLVLEQPPVQPPVSNVSSQPTTPPTETAPSSQWIGSDWWMQFARRQYVDPLAETFLCDTQGGVFLTSLDLYFQAKDDNLPVTVQIRTVVNGTPTQVVLPFSEVTMPAAYIQTSSDATAATSFVFQAPVHLIQGVEYAFVVMTNSNKVKLWVSQLGSFDVTNQSYRITAQPYAGVFFESQNASTWTPDQTKDIKFNMRRAVFTQDVGTVLFNEINLPVRSLITDPFEMTSGSKVIRVNHKNHGNFAGSNVTIAGASGTVNGIPYGELNGTHVITSVEPNSYVFSVSTTNASATGRAGGTTITATENRPFDLIHPVIQQVVLPETDLSWSAKLTSGKSFAGSEAPYQIDSTYTNIKVNDNTSMVVPGTVVSEANRSLLSTSGARSLYLQGSLSTTRNNISPVIDLTRTSMIVVSNLIDNPASVDTPSHNTIHNYVAETAGVGGSALARYITRRVDLNDAATALQIYVNANCPSSSDIQVYYKIRAKGSEADFDALPWVLATPDSPVVINDDPTKYSETSYSLTETILSNVEYSSFAVKIVLTSINSSTVPTCRDFRAIAIT